MKRRWRGRDRGLWGRERWRRIAKAKLQRDPLCAFCFAEGKVVAARVADHKTPHHNDPRLFWVPLDELQSLCLNCHNSRKRYEERHGFRRDVGPDGYPLDPRRFRP
jgi:5-methylcytosine-specific restriction endonuclease McrA